MRGHRDVHSAHRSLHQGLVAEVERVLGRLSGNPQTPAYFSGAQDVRLGQDDDARQPVPNNQFFCSQRNFVIGGVLVELGHDGQPVGIDVHGARRDQDRPFGDD